MAVIGSPEMPSIRWRARILLRGVNPYVSVRTDRARRLRRAGSGPLPVTVQVNGRPDPAYRTNLMPVRGGGFTLYLNGIVRRASATAVGDVVEIALAFDPEYRSGPAHPVPERMQRALRSNARVRANWEALSPSRQKEVLRYLGQIRSDAVRERNIDRAVFVLNGGRARFLGREWNVRPGRSGEETP